MGNEKDLLKKFGLHGDPMLKKRVPESGAAVNHMASPSYLRQSSVLINEALKSGFDVLQLSNGDIVTTGTKTIITKYTWDPSKGKLIKNKASASEARKAAKTARSETERKVSEKATEEA